MAKRKKGRRGHRTGSVITTRRLNGLGNLKQPTSFVGAFVPPFAGGALAGGGAIAAEQLTATAGAGSTLAMVHDWAPAVGLAAGSLGSLGLMAMAGKPAGLAAFAGTAAVAFTLFIKKYLDSAPATQSGLYRGRRQMGAVVAEQALHGLPGRGVGALVMEPYGQQGYGNAGGGEKVTLGAINTSAFGTPGFEMGN
jgi:hypothetical protein